MLKEEIILCALLSGRTRHRPADESMIAYSANKIKVMWTKGYILHKKIILYCTYKTVCAGVGKRMFMHTGGQPAAGDMKRRRQ